MHVCLLYVTWGSDSIHLNSKSLQKTRAETQSFSPSLFLPLCLSARVSIGLERCALQVGLIC